MPCHLVFLGPHNGGTKMPFQKPSQVPLQPEGHITEKLHCGHEREICLAGERLLDGTRTGLSEGTWGGQGRDQRGR